MIIPELANQLSDAKNMDDRSSWLKSDDELGILSQSQQSLADTLKQRGGGALAGVKTAEVEGALPDPTKGIPQAEFQAMTPEAQTRFQQQGGIVQPEPTEAPTSPAERFIERDPVTERLKTAAQAGLETGKEALELGGKGVQDIAQAFTTDEATIGQRVADLGAGAAEVAGGALGGAIATPFAGLAGLFEPEIEATVQAGIDVAKDQLVQTAINQGATPENADIIANEVIGESVQAVTEKMEQAKTALSSVFGEERAKNLVKSAAFALEAIGIEEGVPAAKKLVKETGEAVVKVAPKVAGDILETGVKTVLKKGEKLGDFIKREALKTPDIIDDVVGPVIQKEVRSMLPPKQQKIVDKRINSLQVVEDGNAPLRRFVKTQSDRGIDVKDNLAKTDLLQGAVDDTGTIRTTSKGGPVDTYREFLGEFEDTVSNVLKADKKTVSLKEVEDSMLRNLDNSGIEGGVADSIETMIKKEINALKKRAIDGQIDLSVIHNAKITRNRNIDFTNPKTKTGDKLIARTHRELVEKFGGDDIAKINQELAPHYATIEFLERLDGRKVEGGRLGKNFATILGGAIGSKGGPIGTIFGASLANKLKGLQLKGTFGKGIQGELKMSENLINIQNRAKKAIADEKIAKKAQKEFEISETARQKNLAREQAIIADKLQKEGIILGEDFQLIKENPLTREEQIMIREAKNKADQKEVADFIIEQRAKGNAVGEGFTVRNVENTPILEPTTSREFTTKEFPKGEKQIELPAPQKVETPKGADLTSVKKTDTIKQSVTKPMDTTTKSLEAEARKFKSVDEFVDSIKEGDDGFNFAKKRPVKLFHGTGVNSPLSEINDGTGIFGEGLYLTPNKKTADRYSKLRGGKSGNVLETFLDTGNIKRYVDFDKDSLVQRKKAMSKAYEEGFDGVRIGLGGDKAHYLIFNRESLKTKDQLRQIWKEANATK